MANWSMKRLHLRGNLRRIGVGFGGGIVIAIAMFGIGAGFDRDNTKTYVEGLKNQADQAAFLLQQRMASQLRADINTASHISLDFSLDPALMSNHIREHAQSILAGNPQIQSIGIAPGFVLSQSFPKGSENPAIGKALAERFPDQSGLVRHALTNANKRLPSIIPTDDDFLHILYPVEGLNGNIWGSVELTLSKRATFNAAGFTITGDQTLNEVPDMNIAIREVSGRGNGIKPSYVFGDRSIEERAPVVHRIAYLGGAWEVMVAPSAGWDIPWNNAAAYRVTMLLIGFALVIPIFGASVLIGERNRNIDALKGREAKLLDLSQRFNLAMDSANIGIWEMQDGSTDIYWDERAATLHGEQSQEVVSPLRLLLSRVVPEDREAARAHFLNEKLTGCTYKGTYRIRTPDGAIRYLKSVGARYESNGVSMRTTGIVVDVTSDEMLTRTLREAKVVSDLKNAELELALQELSSREQELEDLSRKLDLALEAYRCGIWEANLDDGIEIWDARMCQLYGLPPGRSIVSQQEWLDIIHPDDREQAMENQRALFDGHRPGSLVARIILPDGNMRYTRSIGQLHIAHDGTRKIIGISVDVTEDALMTEELKAAKEEADAKNAELELAKVSIEHNALHDPLTNLGNRRKLDEELERISLESQSKRMSFALLHLDLDRFKQINDTLGHAAGDAVLAHVAKILEKNVRGGDELRPADVVTRIGGDEFVILIPNGDSHAGLATLANRIVQEVSQPIDFEGFSCRCGVSIGIARASGQNIDARKTLVNADIALYRAKRTGRNRYEFFTQNLQAEVINNKRMGDEILAGIENNEFVTWYQPQFSARTMQLTGVEALVRWQHPIHGIVAPNRFLPIADELNVVATLDQMVMQTALKDRMRWAALGINVPKVSVNVSLRRLRDEGLIASLKTLQIAPGELCFELLESIFLDDRESNSDINIEEIKALGIDIEIDDFGSGHTSIVSLLKLKPKRLKIDRQLVMPILESPRERALVRSIIDIARSLGVETVAEGVETLNHAHMLRELGCDTLQGYAFAKPLSFADFTDAAQRSGWRAAA